MLATRLAPTRDSFAYYDKIAAEFGYEAGPQHRGYLWKVHVDETEELAEEVGRKYLTGPGNIFLEGSRGDVKRHIQNLAGHDRPSPIAARRQACGTLKSRAARVRSIRTTTSG